MNYKIHIVFDRANLKDAFGMSSSNTKATPKNLMTGEEGLEVGQRITINLDSESLDKIYITLAHELAHAIGFNPTDMDAHGHFKDLDRYLEEETSEEDKEYTGEEVKEEIEQEEEQNVKEVYGSKILFDAYYFETLIQHTY